MPDLPDRANDTLSALYRDHHAWLAGWLRAKLGNAGEAADLMQDAFMRLLVRRELLLSEVLREPRAYLTTVAKHVLANHFRRLSLERAYLDALAAMPAAQAPDPEHQLLMLEALQEVDAMLDGLPHAVRAAFLLSQYEGMNQRDIAEVLGVSVRSVKRYVAQALAACILLTED